MGNPEDLRTGWRIESEKRKSERITWIVIVAVLLFLWWSERNDRRGYHDDFRYAANEALRLSAELSLQNKAWVKQHKDYLDALKSDEGSDKIPDHEKSGGTFGAD